MTDKGDPAFRESARRFGAGQRVAILLPLPLAGSYDYTVPPGLAVGAGDFVEVWVERRLPLDYPGD